ncbi:uncharacterized protein LOC106129904 [Amyelois transitella]|uniref:uncharacterized protein LOC106129904 n=1 Tax=Amyelois transitella TaxID=680683 RepID=UPI002990402B|nr:uncharacterized protein LOC106129904 [Amyelois transitella]
MCEIPVKAEPKELECVVCIETSLENFEIYSTEITASGISVHAFLNKFTHSEITFSSDKYICKTCLNLINELEQLEMEYNKLKYAFQTLIRKNPLFEVLQSPSDDNEAINDQGCGLKKTENEENKSFFKKRKLDTESEYNTKNNCNLIDAAATRRRVSYNQLKVLCEFLNTHREVAVGFNKSTQSREHSRKMWVRVTHKLNSMNEGAAKHWKGWSTYWVDYKAKLKRKVASIIAAQSDGSATYTLSEVEVRFLQILGEDYTLGLPGLQDPLRMSPLQANMENPEVSDQDQPSTLSSEKGMNRTAQSEETLHSVDSHEPQQDMEVVESDDDGNDGDSFTMEDKDDDRSSIEDRVDGYSKRHTSPVPKKGVSCVKNQEGTSGLSTSFISSREPVKRRRRRPALSVEAARRILVNNSGERLQIERTKSQHLARIVAVLERMESSWQGRSVNNHHEET